MLGCELTYIVKVSLRVVCNHGDWHWNRTRLSGWKLAWELPVTMVIDTETGHDCLDQVEHEYKVTRTLLVFLQQAQWVRVLQRNSSNRRRQTEYFTRERNHREDWLLGGDMYLALFPGHVGGEMQSGNEAMWLHALIIFCLYICSYLNKVTSTSLFFETERKKKKKKKSFHILRAGFEPATYG